MKVVTVVIGFTFFAALAAAADCSRPAGSRPDPTKPPGTVNSAIPIEHILVIMQENHSFDNYFGRLNSHGYGKDVDGISPLHSNLNAAGKKIHAYHEKNLTVEDVDHEWNAQHAYWNGGRNDGFVAKGADRTIGYHERDEIPYYYDLANTYAIGDRYFCSVIGPTFPNRFYLLAGTSFGHVQNIIPETEAQTYTQKTIFDVLDEHHVSWRYYADWPGYLAMFRMYYKPSTKGKIGSIADYEADLAAGKLPQVAFLDSVFNKEDEHPPADIQVGQAWVKKRITALQQSRYWEKSVLFFTYDENGGFSDHVPPPEACVPDNHAPKLQSGDFKADFDHYGFRVPFIAVSPWAKRHYVSHRTYDHTSILKFIETKFNLPALSRRDANADGLFDLFRFPVN